jgi:ABC-type nitrate/sulfonate/bicarbonate transport system substrate-binding protein
MKVHDRRASAAWSRPKLVGGVAEMTFRQQRSVRSRALMVGALVVTASLAAACSGGSSPSPSAQPSSAAATTPTASMSSSASPSESATPAAFAPPNLSGDTIRLTVGSAPATADTKVALVAQILHSWGATTSVINQTGDPAAIRVILAGDADVGFVAVSTVINSGLMIFGPAQPTLDYHFVGAPSLKSIADLPGHVYGTSNTHGLEALMFADLLAKNNIQPSSVTVTLAGGSSVRAAAMLAGHVDATFLHLDQSQPLFSQGFNDLATMSQATPELADSFMAATSAWVQAHPDLALAVDEAWIKAAQIFNTDKAQWVAAAVAYAGGSSADAASTYDLLHAANTFPAAKSAFASASASAQEALAARVGAINTAPPLSAWFTETYWDQAAAAMGLQ